MTIISAVLKKDYIVISSDSILSSIVNGKRVANKLSFNGKPKYVAFPKLKCIASYFGLANISYDLKPPIWTTYAWLHSKLDKQNEFSTIEEFGQYLKEDLTKILKAHKFSSPRKLGIHLTGFEYINEKWIPELFLISADTSTNQVDFSRRTYLDWKRNIDYSAIPLVTQREEYFDILKYEENYSIYNNGDNTMFNNFMNSYHTAVLNARDLGVLKGGLKKEFYINLTRIPIKQVIDFQKRYYIKESILVGGKIHTIIMDSNGTVTEYKNKLENLK